MFIDRTGQLADPLQGACPMPGRASVLVLADCGRWCWSGTGDGLQALGHCDLLLLGLDSGGDSLDHVMRVTELFGQKPDRLARRCRQDEMEQASGSNGKS